MLNNLIKKFENYEITNNNPLSLEECYFILEREEFVDYDIFRSISDFRDYLEIEEEY